MERFCDICKNDKSSREVLVCHECEAAVHETCYATSRDPNTDWRCRRCALNTIRAPYSCVDCGSNVGAFEPHPLDDKFSIHTLCLNLGRSRERTCCLCHEPHSVCINCASKGCLRWFHVYCSTVFGLRKDGPRKKRVAFCPEHSKCDLTYTKAFARSAAFSVRPKRDRGATHSPVDVDLIEDDKQNGDIPSFVMYEANCHLWRDLVREFKMRESRIEDITHFLDLLPKTQDVDEQFVIEFHDAGGIALLGAFGHKACRKNHKLIQQSIIHKLRCYFSTVRTLAPPSLDSLLAKWMKEYQKRTLRDRVNDVGQTWLRRHWKLNRTPKQLNSYNIWIHELPTDMNESGLVQQLPTDYEFKELKLCKPSGGYRSALAKLKTVRDAHELYVALKKQGFVVETIVAPTRRKSTNDSKILSHHWKDGKLRARPMRASRSYSRSPARSTSNSNAKSRSSSRHFSRSRSRSPFKQESAEQHSPHFSPAEDW